MESYRVTGMPNTGPQRAYTQPSRSTRTNGNGAGSYGLSIRVQGIDGHPYVVLNNQDRGRNPYADPNSNGLVDTDGSFIENYHEYDFRGSTEAGSNSPFGEYRAQMMMQYSGIHNGLLESQGKQSSSLLNFQKHPELLQPYDPETNSLNFHSLPSRPLSQNSSTKSVHSLPQSRSSSLDRIQSPQPPAFTETPAAQPLPPSQSPQPQIAQPQSKPSGAIFNPSKSQPPAVSSANASLDRSHREPDVLPLRRTDSSGPVLQPERSRHSSSSSTNTSRTPLEERDPLFTDAINRHQNRRYIPFLAGSGRDIDTGPIPAVDDLIEKFDGAHQRRGRAGRRNRINPEDRKRSRSVDSAYGLRDGSSYTRGTSMEHVLRPSQLRKSVSGQDSWVSGGRSDSRPSSRATSEPGSPQSTVPKSLVAIENPYGNTKTRALYSFKSEDGLSSGTKISTAALSTSLSKSSAAASRKTSSESEVQVTPDLLKGQQEISQQTHEETAKQILFNYLKDGSTDSDETTKRKVNLVFEKIQTLKSRATASAQGDNNTVDTHAQARALQGQNAELEKELTKLKSQLEEQTTKNQSERKLTSSLRDLQLEHQRSEDESKRVKDKLVKAEKDLQSTVEELFQVKMEREQYQTEIRDLQDQLSEMHDELDGAKRSAADNDRDALMADLMHLKAELQQTFLAKEDQEELLHRRERELTALKGALKEEVSAHDQEVDKMREQYEQEISRLQAALEETKQSSAAAVRERAEVEAAKGAAEGQAGRLTQEADRLRRRAQELESEVAKLNRIIDEAKLKESRLADRVARLEREKKQLEESLAEIKEQEEEMSRANRALTLRLEDVQRNLTKYTSEHKDLEERLQEEKAQKEQFRSMKNDIEDERRLLDRTVEKLQKEMNDIVEASQMSTRELQEQIDIYKEKNRRELTELQKLLKERGLELDKYLLTTQTLQEEVQLSPYLFAHVIPNADGAFLV